MISDGPGGVRYPDAVKHTILLEAPDGDSSVVGVVAAWGKNLGEYVGPGDALLTVRFGEREVEIPADRHGVVFKWAALPGETVEPGEPLVVLSGVAFPEVPSREPASLPALPPGTTVELSEREKALARHDGSSYRAAPHVTTLAYADLTETLRLVEKARCAPLAFIVASVAAALRQHLRFNAMRVGDDAVHLIDEIRLAVGERVLRDADKRSVLQIARELDAAGWSDGSTFTLIDLSELGVEFQTPVIRQPQVGILTIGAPDGNRLPLALTHDARIADGNAAAAFLSAVRRHLEEAQFLFV